VGLSGAETHDEALVVFDEVGLGPVVLEHAAPSSTSTQKRLPTGKPVS